MNAADIRSHIRSGTPVYVASGNTFEHKEHLKENGWQWEPEESVWVHIGGGWDSTEIRSFRVLDGVVVERAMSW